MYSTSLCNLSKTHLTPITSFTSPFTLRYDSPFQASKKSPLGIYCIIQVDRERKESSRHFGIKETQILENLCCVMSACLAKICNSYDQAVKGERVMNLLKTFREITMERNHVSIMNKVYDYVPRLFDVEKSGVFFIDAADQNLMYTITEWEKSEEGVPFITQVAKYPANVGLTGRAIQTKRVVAYDKDKLLQPQDSQEGSGTAKSFIVEVDNYPEAGLIRNALYGPLFDGNGNIVGCIQLLNKKGKNQFDENDLEEFQTILGVIGTTVNNANESFKILNLMISILSNIHNIKTLFSDEVVTLAQLNEVEITTHVKIIKDYLGNLIDSKKQQFFKDGSLLEEVFSKMGDRRQSLKSTFENAQI